MIEEDPSFPSEPLKKHRSSPSSCFAPQYKEQGNKAFKAGDWKLAIHKYSRSLEIDGRSYVNYSNRSAAYLKAGDFARALEDANQCISLRKDYVKGYGRKGSAYHAMKVCICKTKGLVG